ncbi:hypothetical protein [Jidongwangia harbinensis]|uniref:hypothetical protein n=1 Tax=Jidongwangia harbinensis TaxID=2878561 RepID=UPI001CD93C93|nr:hypothetical protein [Jidongwangia harbinensis]MCA2213143.1 hypothetical protein [Jidongwangia harbinensis]
MTRSRAPHVGEPYQRRTRKTRPAYRQPWRCAWYASPAYTQLTVVTAMPDAAGLATQLSPPYSTTQAAALADAAVTDTILAADAMPDSRWAAGVAEGFTAAAHAGGPSLLIAGANPQLSFGMLADAAERLQSFDAVLGPTGEDWWALGFRDPARWEQVIATPEALTDCGTLTLAALRLGMRVAMLPAMPEMRTASDVRAVARRCPPGSMFAETVRVVDEA